ncbi:MAG: penicillin-binding protein 2, partial [Chlamydiales bacterium]|nr:penicillin-binding protein 2 [Chlamydiales bacterium]
MQRKSPLQQALGAHCYKRLVLIALFLFFLFSTLFIQFFKIQILEGDKWKKAADMQHHRIVIEPFKRGLFYSNTSIQAGHPEDPKAFVSDIPKFHLYIDPLGIPQPLHRQIAERLSQEFSVKGEEYEKLFSQFGRKARSRKLISWLDKEQRDKILSWWSPFAAKEKVPKNALYFIQDYQRSYPFGKLLGQVLHTLRMEKQIDSHQPIPTGGLELVFDRFLQGKEGKRFLLRSPRHPLETGEILSYPEDGADVHLTINHYLQAIAEEEIAKAVKNANAKGGWAILMHPRSGEIYALAQYPWFEPSRYSEYFNDSQLREHTKVKAITDPFEPA